MKVKLICIFITLLVLYNLVNFIYELTFLSPSNQKNLEIDLNIKNQSDYSQYPFKIRIPKNLKNQTAFIQNEEKQCKYPEYNFTKAEEAKIWNYKPYPKCSTDSADTISIEDDKIVVSCSSKNIPEFYDFWSPQERVGGSRKFTGKWTPAVPDLRTKTFIFVKCQEKSIYSFVFLRFSQTVSDRAKINAKAFKSLYNTSKETQTSILILTFDSVSKGSAHRNLKKTVKFLNEESAVFNSYEFLNPAVPEIHTQDNMAQILYGETKRKMQEKLGTRFPALNSKPHLEYQNKAIWTHYSSLGYVTMFLHDSVWDYLSFLTGGTILCDHVFSNYWKVVWAVYGFHDHQNGARCIGNQHSHNISFGYIQRFFEAYPDNNKFSYAHLDAAHETKGNIQTVDEDLKDFLENLIDFFNKRNESFAIFLIGDHGQRRSEMQFDIRNSYESRHAMTFIITSKNFGGNGTKEILDYNKENLFSRFDLHLSLKDISYYPYFKLTRDEYQSLQKNFEAKDVKSLFREKSSPLRTCSDLGVRFELCPCSDFESVTSSSELKLLEKGFLPIIYKVLYYVSQEKKLNFNESKIIEFKKFTSSLLDDGLEVLYRISLEFDYNKTAEVNVRGCTEAKIKETKNILEGKLFQATFYVHNGIKMFYQIYEIKGFEFGEDKLYKE